MGAEGSAVRRRCRIMSLQPANGDWDRRMFEVLVLKRRRRRCRSWWAESEVPGAESLGEL